MKILKMGPVENCGGCGEEFIRVGRSAMCEVCQEEIGKKIRRQSKTEKTNAQTETGTKKQTRKAKTNKPNRNMNKYQEAI